MANILKIQKRYTLYPGLSQLVQFEMETFQTKISKINQFEVISWQCVATSEGNTCVKNELTRGTFCSDKVTERHVNKTNFYEPTRPTSTLTQKQIQQKFEVIHSSSCNMIHLSFDTAFNPFENPNPVLKLVFAPLF